MKLYIDPLLATRHPGYRMYTVIASGIDNSGEDEQLRTQLAEVQQRVRRTLNLSQLEEESKLKAWRATFRDFGADPSVQRPALEALLQRVLSSHEIPFINKVVAISNLVSMKYMLPSGGDDLTKIDGDFGLRYATGLETFVPISGQEEEHPAPGEVVYVDDQKVLCRCWIWRQGEPTKITERSHFVAVNVDVLPPATVDEGSAAAEELAALIRKHCGGRTEIVSMGGETLWVSLGATVAAAVATERLSDDSIRRMIDEKGSELSDSDNIRDWTLLDLLRRGNVERVVVEDALLSRLRSGDRISIYQGFDPTSPNMHVGHLVSLRVLRWFQEQNHRVIFLLGDATALIGDPSGRSVQREMLTHEKVTENMATYQQQAGLVLKFEGSSNPVELLKNSDWLLPLTLADMIKLMSSITAQQLLQRDMFQARLKKDEPLYYVETIYPLLQGYDSVAMQVDAELGGRDQLFNMLVGRDLERYYLQKEKFVLTTPLLAGFDGRKMSKTYSNTVNLTAEPFSIFDGIMRVKDELIMRYARLLTSISWSELARLEELLTKDPLQVKEQVAFELVRSLHGEEAGQSGHREFVRVRREGILPRQIPVSSIQYPMGEFSLVDILASANPAVASSKSELRRLIRQGGLTLNGERVMDEKAQFSVKSLHDQILRIGKSRFTRLSVDNE